MQTPDGKSGHVFDESPEAKAFTRWQNGDFLEVERKYAESWRKMLTTLDLSATATRMRELGINSQECKSVEAAYEIATQLVRSRTKPFEQMALLFAFLDIPSNLHHSILERWSIDQYRPLFDYAPYAAHVLVVELFFQIALGANLISSERASNRIDISYLCYLPFSMIFISSDKLHRKCARVFLRKNQEFIWGPDLKAELSRQNSEFSKLPAESLELGLMKFAPAPIGDASHLLIQLWDRHTPNWRSQEKKESIQLSPEAEKKIVEDMIQLAKSNSVAMPEDDNYEELDQMVIQRLVPKRKGSWWLLPKSLKVEDDS
ncbi:hypothetical protein C2U68_05410 [Methylomonas koyamae]|nr:hypothetical protein C2U68_05410 [Methylomonas koyamae]